jgi:hypothetical protein
MFSLAEKQMIASKIEQILLDLKHPEMPKEKPMFRLQVNGREGWSFADIKPNWTFNENNKPGVNPWNEIAREALS